MLLCCTYYSIWLCFSCLPHVPYSLVTRQSAVSFTRTNYYYYVTVCHTSLAVPFADTRITQGPTGRDCDFGDLLMPHPDSCSKFLACSNNLEYEMDCPDNLWFSFELQVRQNLWFIQGILTYYIVSLYSKPPVLLLRIQRLWLFE